MRQEASVRRGLLMAACLLALPARATEPAPPPLHIAAVQKDAVSWVAARLLTEVYRLAGLELVVEPMPAPRAGLLALSGEVDGELIRTEAHGQRNPRLLRIDPPYYRIQVQAFSLASRRVQVGSRADLARYKLAAIRGLSYVPELTPGHPALTLAQNSEQMFRMLQAGRVDLALDSGLAARHVLERLGLREQLSASPELARYELFHYLHPRHRALAPRIAAAIQRLKASGELERLTEFYESMALTLSPERFDPGELAPRRP